MGARQLAFWSAMLSGSDTLVAIRGEGSLMCPDMYSVGFQQGVRFSSWLLNFSNSVNPQFIDQMSLHWAEPFELSCAGESHLQLDQHRCDEDVASVLSLLRGSLNRTIFRD